MTALAENPGRLVVALLAAALVAAIAWRLRALSRDGAVAATLVGGLLVGAGGWWLGATLILFFVSSSALSNVARRRSAAVRQAKGDRRDAIQVIANGGVSLAFAVIGALTGSALWTLGAVVAIAAATADTWATETGRLTQAIPRSLSTLRRVAVGTSGAVSLPGTAASVAGALAIAGFATAGIATGWLDVPSSAFGSAAVVTLGGAAGSILDSVLGATVQERRRCPRCDFATESTTHECGTATVVTGGIRGFDNDIVNVVSVAIPAFITVVACGIVLR